MLDAASLWSFLGIAVLLGLTPGPDNLFVLMQSAQRGWQVGLYVVLGLCLGLVVHTAAVALGLAALLATSSMAFTVLKLLGAAYLLYLAWGAWNAPVEALAAMPSDPQAAAPTMGAMRWVGRGLLMNLTNPKVLIFFLAFLPQFAKPELGAVALQILQLGGIFILATLLVFGGIAGAAGALGGLLQRSPQAQRWLNRMTALVFTGLALRLALVQR